MDYCVYEWYDWLTGKVFYVGSGTEERARRLGAPRSKAFKKKVEELDFRANSRIVCRGLTKEKELENEKALIQKYANNGVELVNVVHYVNEHRAYNNENIICPCCGEQLRAVYDKKKGWTFVKAGKEAPQ